MKRIVEAYDGESVTGFLRGRSGPHNQHETQAPPRASSTAPRRASETAMKGLRLCLTSCLACRARRQRRHATTTAMVAVNRVTVRKNHHPTVKPTDPMRWLVRLVTPAGGGVLDPFTGRAAPAKRPCWKASSSSAANSTPITSSWLRLASLRPRRRCSGERSQQPLIAALLPLVRRVRTDVTAVKKSDGSRWTSQP